MIVGTGSASLSHAMLRTIAPNGHLYTFDFHEQRVKRAHDEFVAHGFEESLVTASLRDVSTDGFDVDSSTADAVFLDLPSPWLVVPFAAQSLKPGDTINLVTLHKLLFLLVSVSVCVVCCTFVTVSARRNLWDFWKRTFRTCLQIIELGCYEYSAKINP